jgi:hypothetical protein
MSGQVDHRDEAKQLLAEITNDDGTVDFGEGGEAYAAAAWAHALLAIAGAISELTGVIADRFSE